nr:hypothetical protein [Thermoanaerobaculales bacterium]
WQAFEMATPDVSLVFSMQMEGYRTPYEAELVVDWDKAWTHQKIEARVKYMWIGAEVEALIDDLVTNGAVRIEVKGESASMEKLLDAAYSKVMGLMFDPMPSAQQPAETAGVGDMMKAILEKAKKNSPVDLFAGYKLTNKRMAGQARIRLRQQRAEPLFVLLTGNVGPLALEWRDDPRFFRAINLEDPTFRQREVSFSFDGDAADFGRVVNHLVVQLRKRHGDGGVTMREAVLEPAEVGTSNRMVFAYSNSGDNDLAQWMEFEWRAVWSFRGGRTHDTGWQETDAFAVALRPPFAVRRLLFDGEPDALEAAGVRSVLARVDWNFLGQERSERLTLRRGAWSDELELVLPAEDPTCSVFLEWHLSGGRKVSRGPWLEESDVVYIDEIPDATEEPVAGGEE